MIFSSILVDNILTAPVVAFAIALIATLLRFDIRIPESLYSILSTYLLLAIGIKGGKALTDASLSELLKPFNRYVASGEINTVVKDIPSKLHVIREKYGQDHQIDELDGITVSTKDYWFNVRASNTEPLLRLNVEGDTKAIMEKARDAALAIIKA